MKIVEGYNVAPAIDQLVDGAQKVLVLVSPYFQPWNHLSTMVRAKLAAGVGVQLLVRGGEDSAKHIEAANQFVALGARAHSLDRLHAKIYLSDRSAILTSMNLYAPSKDSWEVATVLDVTDDATDYQQVLATTKKLFEMATVPAAAPHLAPGRTHPGPNSGSSSPTTRRPSSSATRATGYCIRCSTGIAADPDRPLCRACYASWEEYANVDYTEKLCHLCGKTAFTSMAKPLCRACWERSR